MKSMSGGSNELGSGTMSWLGRPTSPEKPTLWVLPPDSMVSSRLAAPSSAAQTRPKPSTLRQRRVAKLQALSFAAQRNLIARIAGIKVGGTTKAPDYCFRIGPTRKFFVEAKKPSLESGTRSI